VEACDLILKACDIPFWPQLPQRSFKESMILQYAEGMPYLKINKEAQSVWIERDASDELERFYEAADDDLKIAISEEYALGLHVFCKAIKGRRFKTLKGHVTGPLTYTLGLKDRDGKYIFFDEELREISLMLLQAKARWQIDFLRLHCEDIIIFIDEPILSALGSSSYLGVSTEEASRLLSSIVEAIQSAGGIPGIHCCGRADWQLVLNSGVKILSFDAYDYFNTLLIYQKSLSDFLLKGGYLAWGIVPTTDAINSVDSDGVISVLKQEIAFMNRSLPPELVMTQILLTPSCGTGSKSIEETIKVFQLIMRVKEAFL
jgi:hypothetical protein